MKRRDYLKSVSSTAFLPVLSNRVDGVEPPDIDDIQWSQSTHKDNQILRVDTTQPVDCIDLRRYAFGQTSSEPTHERISETRHELLWETPTTINDIHSILFYQNGQQVHETLINLDVNLLTRHIEVDPPRAGRVAIRQKGNAALGLLNRAVVTSPNTQPDYDNITFRNNRRHVALLEETTSYIPAYVTDDAVDAMRGHQTVWVWTKNENGALYPATVDFSKYDPVEVYGLHGAKRQ